MNGRKDTEAMSDRPQALVPLDDPAYEPKYPPINGQVPDAVAKWGPRSQLRWFRRFRDEIGAQPTAVWDAHYCSSEHHRGPCCFSCHSEYLDGYQGGGVMADGWCCCYDERMGR